MIKFLWITLTATLMADIGIMESLKTRATGQGNERVTLDINKNNIDGKLAGVELNLPDRFDVKVSKWWIEKNGVKIKNTSMKPFVLHFKKNHFTISSEEFENYGSRIIGKTSTSGSGDFSEEKISGKIFDSNVMTDGGIIYSKSITEYTLSGNISASGLFHLVLSNGKETECQVKIKKDDSGLDKISAKGVWRDCSILKSYHNQSSNIKVHYLLQLPINQTQSSQTFIPDTPAESEPIQEQPITIPKVNLSANVAASVDATEEEPKIIEAYDPCKDPNRDEAVEKYCKNKAYNKKLDEEEDARKKAEYEAKEKAEKEYQAKLAKYNEEERHINLKVIRENEKKRKEIAIADKQRDKAFRDKLAKDMQEIKAKQAEKAKAQRKIYEAKMIVHQYVDKADDRKRHLDKIDSLSDKDTSLKDATKIKNAVRKQHYESRQLELEAEQDLQLGKAQALKESSDYAGKVRDTSLTINKVIAKLDPTGTGDKIVEIQENLGNLIDAAEKGGIEGVIVKSTSIVTNKFTKDIGGDIIEKTHKQIKDYNENGIKLDKSDKVYDKDGNRLTRYKKGDRAYNKNKEEISFSTGRRVLKNIFSDVVDGKNPIKKAEDAVKNIKEGVATGDFNKVVNAGLDMKDAKDSIDGGTDNMVKKLEEL